MPKPERPRPCAAEKGTELHLPRIGTAGCLSPPFTRIAWNGSTLYLTGNIVRQCPVDFLPVFFRPDCFGAFLTCGLGNESVTLYSLSNVRAASNAVPFLPLKPLMSLVVPEEKSCARCRSVSSLFRKRLKTSSPQPSLLHLASFCRRMIFPFPHLGHTMPPLAVSGKRMESTSSVIWRA